jgi:hypothetical protein
MSTTRNGVDFSEFLQVMNPDYDQFMTQESFEEFTGMKFKGVGWYRNTKNDCVGTSNNDVIFVFVAEQDEECKEEYPDQYPVAMWNFNTPNVINILKLLVKYPVHRCELIE